LEYFTWPLQNVVEAVSVNEATSLKEIQKVRWRACLRCLSAQLVIKLDGSRKSTNKGGLERKKPLERNCYLMIYVDDESARTFVFVST
jgi:hypothetical protein